MSNEPSEVQRLQAKLARVEALIPKWRAKMVMNDEDPMVNYAEEKGWDSAATELQYILEEA